MYLYLNTVIFFFNTVLFCTLMGKNAEFYNIYKGYVGFSYVHSLEIYKLYMCVKLIFKYNFILQKM